MTSGGNSFNDFPEIVPTREITTTKIETTFLAFSSVAVQGLFVEWAQCCSIGSTQLSPAPVLWAARIGLGALGPNI